MVNRDKPLFRGPKDHRLLAAPAVRIAVHERLLVEEMAGRLEPIDDHPVGREDLLAGQPLGGLGREPARLVDRAQDRKPVGAAGLVVFGTVAGGRVNQAGSVVDTDVIRQHDRADAIDERVAIFGMLELLARGTGRSR